VGNRDVIHKSTGTHALTGSQPTNCPEEPLFKVLDQIGRDLKRTNRYGELEKEYLKVREINEYSLAPMLLRWSQLEMKNLLTEGGFSVTTYWTDDVYAGQSMLVCARK